MYGWINAFLLGVGFIYVALGESDFRFFRSLGWNDFSYLCQEPYPAANIEFIENHGIRLFHFGIEGNKVIALLCVFSLK